MSRLRSRSRRHHGVAAIYAMVLMVVLIAIASLAVDLARARLVKTELQRTADAAARAAAVDFASGVTSSTNAAVTIAGLNKADGTSVVLDSASDVEFGNWNSSTKTFAALAGTARSGADAIRVTARRTAARGTAVPLLLAKVIGRQSQDVTASSIARVARNGVPGGFIGLISFLADNNLFAGSYNTTTTLIPTRTSARSNGLIASNFLMGLDSGQTVKGDIWLGPNAWYLHGAVSLTGVLKELTSLIAEPAAASTTSATNPLNTPAALSVSGTKTLPGGNYYFTSLALSNNAVLQFSGAATVRINGDVVAGTNATIAACGSIPSNLKIYQTGGFQFFTVGSDFTLTADVEGPDSAFTALPGLVWRGKGTYAFMTFGSDAELYYDESEGPVGGTTTVSLMK